MLFSSISLSPVFITSQWSCDMPVIKLIHRETMKHSQNLQGSCHIKG